MTATQTVTIGHIAMRAPGARSWAITGGPLLQEMAMRWSAVVRNRERWDTADGSAELEKRAQLDLLSIGMTEGALDAIIQAGLAEISMTWTKEEWDWEARVMPWEFVLNLATRQQRDKRILTVWRHLDCGRALWPVEKTPPTTCAFIDNVPTELKTQLQFQLDRQLIENALGIRAVLFKNNNWDQLEKNLKDLRPDVVHVAAIDDIEAAQLSGQPLPKRRFGLSFHNEQGKNAIPHEWAVAQAMGPARLVTYGGQRTSRIGAMSIGIGYANASLGFQDDIDRDAVRAFYAEFYRQWRLADYQLLTAFVQTRIALRTKRIAMNGAGIVLWTDRSLIDSNISVNEEQVKRTKTATKVKRIAPAESDALRLNAPISPVLPIESVPVVEIEIEPITRLNYSLLHNNRDLFSRFSIIRLDNQVVHGVCVRVILSAGGQDVAWRAQLSLTDAVTDLRAQVRVPVVAALGRLRESVRSTLLVEVQIGERLIHQSTHPVQLLAGDEWTDDDVDRQWLPSFVLPRDLASGRIVDQAQRALCTLADDPNASFDGYQGLGYQVGDDPAHLVDTQVQAIWAALTWDIGLSYVNPPPTYTAAAQRVRSPSAILEEKRGTCLDLALLLAACWERIGLRPVIILLKGHALPAYWRSEAAWDAFRHGERSNVPADRITASTASWMISDHAEVVAHMRVQALWPVEATRIPKRSGFAAAIHAGMDALRLVSDFDCLIDVSVARDKGVLPLP